MKKLDNNTSIEGQEVSYLLIPRYKGDVENPKVRVRGVMPRKQKY